MYAVVLAVLILGCAIPAQAVKVQILKQADPEKDVPVRVLREEAMSQAFAQAILSESGRMTGELPKERSEALKWLFGKHYEDFITGYKDLNVKQEEAGVSVSVDVNVNRKVLRETLLRMGLLAADPKPVDAVLNISNGKFALSAEQQAEQNDDLAKLMAIYAVRNATAGAVNGTSAADFKVTRVSKSRWRGELQAGGTNWAGSGPDMESVWRQLWEKYYGANSSEILSTPKAVLVVSGWFNPEGVREFDRKLKSWDSAVQEVLLQDVEMKPTAVSASWSLDVSDQWVLKSYLNDYLPPRGLSFSLKGLEGDK